MTCSQLFHIFFTIFFTACSWIIHLFHVSSMTLLELVHNLFISCSWRYLLLNCSQLVHWLVHDLFMTFSCLVQDLFTTFSSFFHNMFMTCSHLLPSSAPAPTPAKLGWVCIIPSVILPPPTHPPSRNSRFFASFSCPCYHKFK